MYKYGGWQSWKHWLGTDLLPPPAALKPGEDRVYPTVHRNRLKGVVYQDAVEVDRRGLCPEARSAAQRGVHTARAQGVVYSGSGEEGTQSDDYDDDDDDGDDDDGDDDDDDDDDVTQWRGAARHERERKRCVAIREGVALPC